MNVWELIVLQPVVNVLIMMTHYLFDSFGLAIIALTILTRLVMYPLTMRQLRATKAMQSLQPKMREIQQKYAKDKARLAQEQMRLYKESGVSPLGCMVPMLIQLPIWIALFQAIMLALAVIPESLLNMSRHLYSWPVVFPMIPLGNHFLGMDLSESNWILALLVGASMWVQQKMITPTAVDPAQQRQSQMMLWMMPLMFFFLSLNFPSGLALYWVVSNIISIVMQYYATGLGALRSGTASSRSGGRDKKYIKRIAEVEMATPTAEVATGADIVETVTVQEEGEGYGGTGDKRQERRPSYPKSLRQTRRQPRSGRRRNPKRR